MDIFGIFMLVVSCVLGASLASFVNVVACRSVAGKKWWGESVRFVWVVAGYWRAGS